MNQSNAKRIIKVFIASPGDLAIERRAFKDTIDELNKGFGRGADVEFVPLGWEDALSQVGRRSQAAINEDVDACDVFVLVMWRRWGQEAPDASPYTSYTEEEFYRALTRFEKSGAPTIFVFFKHIDPGQMADPGPQLAKVLEFRKKLEQTRKVLYRQFIDDAAFKVEIDRHLVAYTKGEIEPPGEDRRVPLLPESALAEIEKARAEAKAALRRAEKAEADAKSAQQARAAAENVGAAKAAELSLALAERAAKAALDGRIEEARQDFAKALDGTTNLRALYLGYEFFDRIGELDEAERLLRRRLSISGPDSETANTSAAIGNLGNIYFTRGDLDQAEAMYRKALEIDEKLGRLEGMANDYSNLGNVNFTCGDLDRAEAMYRNALEINERFGRLEAMAIQHGSLGGLYFRRGDLDQAEAMLRKALEIEEKLGRLVGLASDYGNLGNVYSTRGELKQAEAMLHKTLEIFEKLGRREGMASAYGNLGVIYKKRGDLHGAEAMHRKALENNEMLGRLEGMGIQYGNLGRIYSERGDRAKAREYWTNAKELFTRGQMPHKAKQVEELIEGMKNGE